MSSTVLHKEVTLYEIKLEDKDTYFR